MLLDELFETGSRRFLPVLLETSAHQKLTAFAERFYTDRRPWARQALLDYIDDGCDRPWHRGLVKRLFKRAERAGDDEAMVHFMVAFDRLIEHKLSKRSRWSWQTGEWLVYYSKKREGHYPARLVGDKLRWPYFSKSTRLYLQRRALRYLRRIGWHDRERFRKAAIAALVLYRDDHREHPVRLVDAWGLMHLLYHGSGVIWRDPRGIRIQHGRTLGELAPAPLHPDAWRGCLEDLLDLAVRAQALVVRRFAITWLEKEYAEELAALDIERLRPLLTSPHGEVQLFAVKLLKGAKGLEKLPVRAWLALLAIDNPLAIPILCELVEQCVTPDRLTLEQCVDLACARPQPVAALGLSWTRSKSPGPDDLAVVARLRDAQAPAVRDEGVAWLTAMVRDHGSPELVRDLIDARYDDVRVKALELIEEVDRFRDEPSLWAALAESPYDDARGFLIRHLRSRLAFLSEGSVRYIWATTLLNVHRGSRTKRLVLRQLAERIVAEPAKADELLPLLAVTLRSVREPERVAALAAIGRAAFDDPSLRTAIGLHVPELELFPAEGRVPS